MVAQRADIFLCALIFLLFFVLKKSCFVTTDRISITLNSVDVYDIIKETFINSTLWNSSIQYGDLLLCVLIFFIFCVKRSCFVTADRIYITLHSFDIYDVIQETFINPTFCNISMQYGKMLLCALTLFNFCVKTSFFVTADEISVT